jgi:hypothetical protein
MLSSTAIVISVHNRLCAVIYVLYKLDSVLKFTKQYSNLLDSWKCSNVC